LVEGSPSSTGLSSAVRRPFLELLFRAGEADLQSFDLAEPVVLFGFGDAGVKVGDDLAEPVDLGGVGPEQRAS